jgi:hypothetical protein
MVDSFLEARLSLRMRTKEKEIRRKAAVLARSIHGVIGGIPLTDVGDRVATPLQKAQEVYL